VFIFVKNILASIELWVDDDFELIAVEMKGMDPKYPWETTCIYRARNESILAIEILAALTLLTQNLRKRII